MAEQFPLEDFECCVLNAEDVRKRKEEVANSREAFRALGISSSLMPAERSVEFENSIRSIGLKVQLRRGHGVICPHYDRNSGDCKLTNGDCYALYAL